VKAARWRANAFNYSRVARNPIGRGLTRMEHGSEPEGFLAAEERRRSADKNEPIGRSSREVLTNYPCGLLTFTVQISFRERSVSGRGIPDVRTRRSLLQCLGTMHMLRVEATFWLEPGKPFLRN